MTLKELALLAGVSVSTASRVLNKNDIHAAGKETRERIWELAQKTKYVPNKTAQLLHSGEPEQARYALACIFARTGSTSTDPFFSQIYQAARQECLKSRSVITDAYTVEQFLQTRKANDVHRWDGILVLGRYTQTLSQELTAKYKNVVCIGLNPFWDNYDQVMCSGYSAARMAVEYLYSLGHREIGYIGEKETEIRYRGYYETMREYKLPLNQALIIESKQSAEGGCKSAGKFLVNSQRIPTALFCANDITAIGVMDAITKAGLSVPGDISVIGIDDIELCQNTSPLLTSVAIPKEELGRMGVKVLLDQIKGGHRLPIKVEIPFKLCIRQSCAAPRNT